MENKSRQKLLNCIVWAIAHGYNPLYSGATTEEITETLYKALDSYSNLAEEK